MCLKDYDKSGIEFTYSVKMNKHSMFRSYIVTAAPIADYYRDRPFRLDS